MNEEITKLPAEYEEAARLHCAIVADAQAAAFHIISLGKNLKEMNEKKLYLQLGFPGHRSVRGKGGRSERARRVQLHIRV